MKRILWAIILVCCTLTMTAQNENIRVKYSGAKPGIINFADAYINSLKTEGIEECDVDESLRALKFVWKRYKKGLKLDENDTLIIDEKNGYMCFESKNDDSVLRIEMCYWNESDGKHKLFASSVGGFKNGRYSPGQFDFTYFFRYTNATKRMKRLDGEEIGVDIPYKMAQEEWVLLELPRVGKDINVSFWNYKTQGVRRKILKWKGRKFGW